MARQRSSVGSCILFLSVFTFLLRAANAQVGTQAQDITTMAGYSLQKECARECFVRTTGCSVDFLGYALDCAPYGCSSRGWLAMNDCYCRPDLQAPGQEYLSSCISSACTVGDVSIDANSAGSIYASYCVEKGYTAAAAPADVPAQTTTGGSGGSGAATRTGGVTIPQSTSSSSSGSNATASTKKSLSVTEIVGIAVGAIAGLAFLVVLIKMVWKWCTCINRKPPQPQLLPPVQQQPFYPTYPPSYAHPPAQPPQPPAQHNLDADIGPDDSVSMVGGVPQLHNQTLVSDAPPSGYPPRPGYSPRPGGYQQWGR